MCLLITSEIHITAVRSGWIREVVNGRHASRAQHLEELRGWSWDANSDRWVETYLKLKAWVAAHGGRWPLLHPAGRIKRTLSASEAEEGFLGGWVGRQRSSHRGGKEKLDSVYETVNGRQASRAQLLEQLREWRWATR